MEEYINWEAHALHRVENIKVVHEQQRARLEASIESNPVQSRYSKPLLALMHSEEACVGQGGDISALGAKLERMLRLETKRMFELRARRNQEKWTALLERQREGCKQLLRQLKHELAQLASSHEAGTICGRSKSLVGLPEKIVRDPTRVPRRKIDVVEERAPEETGVASRHKSRCWRRSREPLHLSPEVFRAREAEIRAMSAAHWLEDERFNLENAFGLQLERLEVDWSAHEAKLIAECEARRTSIEARRNGGVLNVSGRLTCRSPHSSTGAAAAYGSTDGSANRVGGCGTGAAPWRSSEKQPDTRRRSMSSGSKAWRGGGSVGATGTGENARTYRASAADRELEKIDEAFATSMENLRLQKIAAQRWIRRQHIRMEAQLETISAERTAREELLRVAAHDEALLVDVIKRQVESIAPASP